MLWKEITLDRRQRHRLGRALLGSLALASLAPAGLIFLTDYGPPGPGPLLAGRELALNLWVRAVGTIVACVGLLAVALNAGESVTTEREKGTLDSLLASPLTGQEILFAKWLGSIVAVARWALPWLGVIWGVALVAGALHVIALAALALTWLAYATAFASIGLWVSVVSKTTLRATVVTVGLALGASCWGWPPPLVFVLFTFQGLPFADMTSPSGAPFGPALPYIAATTVGLWVIAGLWLRSKANQDFRSRRKGPAQ
jgi:ABC-type transport system involved in multi-copper enzyme maturation permease subunit